MQDVEHRDRDLLTILQTGIPVSSTPFALIGQDIEMSEKEVIKRAARLKSEGLIRRISGIFDSRQMGYSTCLVAARVPEHQVEVAAATINLHPGVFQNYLRTHEFNLWFTIAIAPDSILGLQRTVEILGDDAHCAAVRLLPTIRVLKSGGEVIGDSDADNDSEIKSSHGLNEREITIVRLLQRDFPLQPRPFDELGAAVGIPGDEVLDTARQLRAAHQLRGVAATLEIRKPNFSATTMGVWTVPESGVDQFASHLTDLKAVSHAYLRPVYADWPYNVFTTIHGRSVDECDATLAEIEAATSVKKRGALYPVREFKKVRIDLFSPEQKAWEEARASRGGSSASAVS